MDAKPIGSKEAQEIKLERNFEMCLATAALIRRRHEAEMGSIQARRQLEALETEVAGVIVHEEDRAPKEGYAK